MSSSRLWRRSLRTAANQSVSAVSDQPGQVEQRDQERRVTPLAFVSTLCGGYKRAIASGVLRYGGWR
jgi:hypothetical protein